MSALSIVTVNVSQTLAPTPSTLQQSGALISQGSTNLPKNALGLLTAPSDYEAIAVAPVPVTSLTWTSNVVTVVTTQPHGYTVGDVVPVTISGATPVGYNGTFNATVTTTTGFTYPLTTNPGTATAPGAFLIGNAVETLAMVTTFFAQGSSTAVYVLELGEGSAAEGVTTLTAWLIANSGVLYSVVVPYEWDSESTFTSLIAAYEADTAKFYFWVTTTVGTYARYTAQMKNVFALIEAPAAPNTEFTICAPYWKSLSYAPSAINKVTPFSYSFVVGVTAYPTVANAALRTTLKAAKINIIGTGSEGGISNTILLWGTTKDGMDFTYWYSVDWVQINLDLDISNAIINGSNNPQNPLYYDQHGINRLQAVAEQTMQNGITFGLVLGPVTVTATPFADYVIANPGDYPLGIYSGLATTYTPQRGFIAITFNLQVSEFPAS